MLHVFCFSRGFSSRGELVGSWRSVTGDTAFKATHLYKYQDVCMMSILANNEQLLANVSLYLARDFLYQQVQVLVHVHLRIALRYAIEMHEGRQEDQNALWTLTITFKDIISHINHT